MVEPGDEPAEPGITPRLRRLDDPMVMRALAHPLRIQLLELISLHGPLTATECAERTGESPASCSFHLRMLAKYGFVEEAEGGTGRQRPWQRTAVGHSWSAGPEQSESREAAAGLAQVIRSRTMTQLEDFLAHAGELAPAWLEASMQSGGTLWLTPDELARMDEAIQALTAPFLSRFDRPEEIPAGAMPVQVVVYGFPRRDLAADRPPTGETSAASEGGDDDA
jgi:DNA-binding transcriptional ArsR family regulator